MGVIDFIALFRAVIEEISKCLEDRRREEVEATLMNPGMRERRVIMQILRSEGIHGRQLREETDEAMGLLSEMDAEDISCLLDDAEWEKKTKP
jgi:hypothetical protein